MKHEDQSSSEDEGFYKPSQVKVEDEPHEPSEPLFVQRDETGSANELITQSRPTDYLPRILSSFHELIPCHEEVNNLSEIPLEELTSIRRDKIKKSRYQTLQEKYANNSAYQCLYSKVQGAQASCNSAYIFSLNQTTDYNPKDYQTVAEDSQSFSTGSPFESRFQSGNLLLAYKCLRSAGEEYDLILQNDTNTRGYNSWFFFSFRNGNKKNVRFNIVNLIKRHTLFQEGVRPVGLSLKNQALGWRSIGSQLDYQKSFIIRQILTNPPTSKHYYTLSFTVQFQHLDDTLYIAMNYPYTYTRMTNFIERLGVNRLDVCLEKNILCYSLSNNAIPVLRIKHQDYRGNGKKIVVMARQHPGETVGSYVLEGFLKKIVEETELLKQYEVIAIPMVNPDGVIYGNFRTNLSGFDLNRQWQDPNRWMHPQIYSISKYLHNLDGISFVMDFHGHSKKYNSFIYACTGEPSYTFKVFPYIYSKNLNFFSIKDCTYNLTPDKERTARIQIYRMINRPQVFTLETSFFGYEKQNGQKYRYKMKDLIDIGKGAVQSLKTYLLRKKNLTMFEKEVKEKQILFQQWSKQMPQEDIESQSNPSQDELTPVERNQKVIATRAGKRSKGVSPSKKRSKKKKDSSILNIGKLKLATEEKSETLFERQRKSPRKKQSSGTIIVSKNKIGSEKAIPLSSGKTSSKKVEKAVSIVSPPLPYSQKPKTKPLTKPQGPSFWNSTKKSNLQSQKKQTEGNKIEEVHLPKEKPKTITSNLFNKPNYFSHFQQKIFKKEVQASHNKTQSLQISSIRRQQTFHQGMDMLKKLISAEEEEKEVRWQQNQRHREKLYMIRENKIISSTARLNQQAMKKNIEEELSNRTQALINCQKKMNEISLDDPLLRSQSDNYAIEYLSNHLRQTCNVRAPKFPSIKGDKKRDYFNF